jgi:hypothetical protein
MRLFQSSKNPSCRNKFKRLSSQMPGVTSSSPSSSLPELPRIRTTLPAACSKVTAARGKVGRAKVHGKAKADECDESASLARHLSPPPLVDPEQGKRRCSWITANSGELFCYCTFCYKCSSPCVFFFKFFLFFSFYLFLALQSELTWTPC